MRCDSIRATLIFIEGLRPSNSPTRSLAGTPHAPLRSRGSLTSFVRFSNHESASAGRGGSDLRRKETFEADNVAVLGCCDESMEKMSWLRRARADPAAITDVLPSASDHLPRVGLFKPKDVRDVAVWIVERLSKNEGGLFGRSQPFDEQ